MRFNRRSIEARLKKAEHAIAFRVVDRAAELLRAEVYAAPPHTQEKIMRGVARVRKSGAAPQDAAEVLLKEIAKTAPDIARRIAAAVGVELPSPGTASSSA
ncbi:MAG TPA: hypothetical protein VMU42_14415 [Candidatus Sulfotelmatobacter sp.]|nr:hypothetical protein [Candidatus Sulfotelmatobacter sp.]